MSDDTRHLPEEPAAPQEGVLDATSADETFSDVPLRHTGSHPVSVGHLVMGLVFLAIVGAWALIQSDTVTGSDIRWLLPLPWVVGGAVGLAAAAISGVRRHGVGR